MRRVTAHHAHGHRHGGPRGKARSAKLLRGVTVRAVVTTLFQERLASVGEKQTAVVQ